MYINISKMSFVNYYPKPKQNEFSYLITAAVAVSITCIVCIVWYQWALDYRYSSERISGKLLSKNDKKIDKDTQVKLAADGRISADHTTASAVVTVYNKSAKDTVDYQERVTLLVQDICSPLDNTCVSL